MTKAMTDEQKQLRLVGVKCTHLGTPLHVCPFPTVNIDPVMEAIARKLHGIVGVPCGEQEKMIRRAAKAGAKTLRGQNETSARSERIPEWAIRAAERITAGTKHEGTICYHGKDEDGVWRWLLRTTKDVASIIAEEVLKI